MPPILRFFLFPGLLLLLSGAPAMAQLERGMSIEQARILLGREVSSMAAGERQILIFDGSRRLEFVDGQLQKDSAGALGPAAPSAAAERPATSTAGEAAYGPILDTGPVRIRDDQTITESATPEFLGPTQGDPESELAEALQRVQAGLDESGAEAIDGAPGDRGMTPLGRLVTGFVLEFIITGLVVAIAFGFSGFPILKRQLLLLSLSVALTGAVLEAMIQIGPLHPIRGGVGFLVLLALLRPLTDVQSWTTAIRIALLARIITLVLLWLMGTLLLALGSV